LSGSKFANRSESSQDVQSSSGCLSPLPILIETAELYVS